MFRSRRHWWGKRHQLRSGQAPPRNGTATVGDGDASLVPLQPGFTGADAFEFTMSGTSDGRPGTSTVRVQVTVQ